jgi:hypothetical protein
MRALGLAAIAGGTLRVVDSFATQVLSPGTLAALYFVTDVLLLLAIAGIYWSRKRSLGTAGVIGAAMFVLGILLVRASAFGILRGASGYEFAAAICLFGLVILSAELLFRRTGDTAAAVLWLSAFVLGAIGGLGLLTPTMTILAGAAFGAGFVAAGWKVIAGRQLDLVAGV